MTDETIKTAASESAVSTRARHTPGPWTFESSKSGGCIYVGDDNEIVCVVDGFHDHPGNVANARLIAAAPDMLATLQSVHHALSNTYDGMNDPFASIRDVLKLIEPALAKATTP